MTYEEIFQILRETIAEAGDNLGDIEDDNMFREFTWYYLGKLEATADLLNRLQ